MNNTGGGSLGHIFPGVPNATPSNRAPHVNSKAPSTLLSTALPQQTFPPVPSFSPLLGLDVVLHPVLKATSYLRFGDSAPATMAISLVSLHRDLLDRCPQHSSSSMYVHSPPGYCSGKGSVCDTSCPMSVCSLLPTTNWPPDPPFPERCTYL